MKKQWIIAYAAVSAISTLAIAQSNPQNGPSSLTGIGRTAEQNPQLRSTEALRNYQRRQEDRQNQAQPGGPRMSGSIDVDTTTSAVPAGWQAPGAAPGISVTGVPGTPVARAPSTPVVSAPETPVRSAPGTPVVSAPDSQPVAQPAAGTLPPAGTDAGGGTITIGGKTTRIGSGTGG